MVGRSPLAKPVLYLRQPAREASPQAISGRTSYLQVRLAFHLYPQVIPQIRKSDGCGPPEGFTLPSACSWVAHLVSGLLWATCALFTLAFASASAVRCLNLATQSNSSAHSPKGTPSGWSFNPSPLTACRRTVSGSISLPSSGSFSPFPHGTGSLSVARRI